MPFFKKKAFGFFLSFLNMSDDLVSWVQVRACGIVMF
jgi:hypothetical protein